MTGTCDCYDWLGLVITGNGCWDWLFLVGAVMTVWDTFMTGNYRLRLGGLVMTGWD